MVCWRMYSMVNCVDTYKDSGVEWIGKIPQDWKLSKYKYFARSGMGETILSEQLVENGIPVYSATQEEKVFGYVSEANVKLKCGDFVIPARGNSIGCVTFVKNDLATCTQTTIFSKLNGICNKFLYYCCLGLKDHWFNFDDTAIPQITVKQVQNNPLPLPTIQVQQAIADYLDKKCGEIDKIVETEKAVIEKLKEYKQSIITEAVTKGLDKSVPLKDSGIEWIGKIPQHWESIKLKFCTYIRARLGWKGLKAEEYVEEGYPFLSAFNIVNSKLVFEDLNFINQFRYDESPEIKLQEDDVLLVKDGAGIGKCAIVENMSKPSTVNGSIAVITTDNSLKGKFLYYYFLSNLFQAYIDRLKDGMGVPHLFQSDLREITIVIPKVKEQQQIAEYLDKKCDEIDKAITDKEKLIEKFTEYKKSLIYECVTGKKEVA